MYVTIEGIDTAGKSTQIEALRTLFPNAVFTKEPGGTNIGQTIRSMILNGELKNKHAEMFMFLADRAEHTHQVIIPNIDSLIISDRSCVSGVAYATVQNVCDMNTLVQLNRLATDNHLPHHVFILRLTPQELTYRLSQKE
ncbi:MAG TPA: dTMP kinase, partial [Sulfuricurvum sp.]|nr:dTMP kinase [Sulfuricurvum sp.]